MLKKIFLVGITLTIISFSMFDTYVACGCGCCGSSSAALIPQFTLHPHDLIQTDQDAKNRDICSLVGCSIGTRYVFLRFSR